MTNQLSVFFLGNSNRIKKKWICPVCAVAVYHTSSDKRATIYTKSTIAFWWNAETTNENKRTKATHTKWQYKLTQFNINKKERRTHEKKENDFFFNLGKNIIWKKRYGKSFIEPSNINDTKKRSSSNCNKQWPVYYMGIWNRRFTCFWTVFRQNLELRDDLPRHFWVNNVHLINVNFKSIYNF